MEGAEVVGAMAATTEALRAAAMPARTGAAVVVAARMAGTMARRVATRGATGAMGVGAGPTGATGATGGATSNLLQGRIGGGTAEVGTASAAFIKCGARFRSDLCNKTDKGLAFVLPGSGGACG
jgi:hypothetical protein